MTNEIKDHGFLAFCERYGVRDSERRHQALKYDTGRAVPPKVSLSDKTRRIPNGSDNALIRDERRSYGRVKP